jgi:hypothetical protein
MQRMLAGLAATAIALALGATAFAKVETVQGTLVDQGCYRADKTNTGEKHTMQSGPMENCATACAKGGLPVALVTTDGRLYTVTGDYAARKNEKLLAHMAHTVELTGNVTTDKDGLMKIAATNLRMISK